MRVCSTPGCPTIHDLPGSRCPAHETAAKRQHWKRTRAYSTRGHRAFRNSVLTRDPICTLCRLTQSTDADHYPMSRTQLIDAGLNPNDPTYGRGLCSPCHKRETAAHQPGGWNARH